ncbi:uncharacterized protein LOC116603682 [Nematostella vectensis]|uniref:uncharacterized protein LOC116603682 n=1 Tax=Nematostella vectensis TaxID=45351 RepID=UPI0020774D44|nr:uncharacterized protein LOC116603682 [Nematostella vectensis]
MTTNGGGWLLISSIEKIDFHDIQHVCARTTMGLWWIGDGFRMEEAISECDTGQSGHHNWNIFPPRFFQCDDNSNDVSAGDFWRIYVR